ncbi:hypothetical protein BH24ACT3_BH24ACT3_00700 [soil metagenome]
MASEPTWEGLTKGTLMLGVLWWAWVGYAWLTSVVDPEEGARRIAIFAALALLVVSLCVPEAFEDLGLAFAVFYGLVGAGQLVLFLLASRRRRGSDARSGWGWRPAPPLGSGCLVVASFVDGTATAGSGGGRPSTTGQICHLEPRPERLISCIRGRVHATARPGRDGQMPPRTSLARAIRASGEPNLKAMRVSNRSLPVASRTAAARGTGVDVWDTRAGAVAPGVQCVCLIVAVGIGIMFRVWS